MRRADIEHVLFYMPPPVRAATASSLKPGDCPRALTVNSIYSPRASRREGIVNPVQHDRKIGRVRCIHFDTRPKVECSETSDLTDAGEDLGMRSLVVQMSRVPRPIGEPAGRQLRRIFAVDMDNSCREVEKSRRSEFQKSRAFREGASD